MRNLNITISQGSVATSMRCGEIFIDRFIANFLLKNVTIKNFLYRSIFVEDMNNSIVSPFLLRDACSAKRGIAIVSRPSVCLSDDRPYVCDDVP